MSITSVILIVLLLIIIGSGGYLYVRIKKGLQQFSRTAFGVDSIADGISLQQDILADTPKSVSGMTTLCLPQIRKDFPEFSLPEYIHKGENLLKTVLTAVEAQDMQLLDKESVDLKNQIRVRIEDQIQQGVKEHFQDIQIHQTEISRYQKLSGCCMITLQSAVSYLYWKDANGKAVAPSKKVQAVYETALMYIQDISLLPAGTTAITVICPQCGAPVRNVGAKFCEYCKSAIEPVNVRVWQFVKITKM